MPSSTQTKTKSIKAANLLLSLSLIPGKNKKIKKKKQNREGVFECKTCNRKFPSFQALGGHRTSHLRPKVRSKGLDLVIGEKMVVETKRHVCGLCGKEFSMGQALGGHMRLHKTSAFESEFVGDRKPAKVEFDLNMHPFKEEEISPDGFNGDYVNSRDSRVLLLKLFY